jgi:hypothetical protein
MGGRAVREAQQSVKQGASAPVRTKSEKIANKICVYIFRFNLLVKIIYFF